ncbi:MAG TPA: D-alanyl-D-alanine carboxypeptidase family protein [Ktedonobacteraceae bacterium]
MDRRRLLAIILLVIALLLLISVPLWFFSPLSSAFDSQANLNAPPLTPIALTPIPQVTPQATLLPKGKPGKILAQGAILVEAGTSSILYEKNAETPFPMASTTKIMTALIALQAGKLNQVITIGQDAVNEDSIGSNANLVSGDKLSLKELLYALMLPSGDDAAVAIADSVAGSQNAFTTIMNIEAQKLHLFQTHFYDPTGLDTDLKLNPIPARSHYTTAYDFVRLANYAMSIPFFTQIVSTPTYHLAATATHGNFNWKNTNTMLTTYKGTLGIKTGWTGAAGGCLVFAAKRNGLTLIGVVLHSSSATSTQLQDEQTRVTDAETLLNWGFSVSLA